LRSRAMALGPTNSRSPASFSHCIGRSLGDGCRLQRPPCRLPLLRLRPRHRRPSGMPLGSATVTVSYQGKPANRRAWL
jgi:hypothetical protein